MRVQLESSQESRFRLNRPVTVFGGKKASVPASLPCLQTDLFDRSRSRKGEHRFAVIGDAGSGLKAQRAIADQMAEQYEKKPFASVLVLGDNVYEDGEPHLFEERIAKPYKPLLKAGVKFYPVMGNHDVRKGFGEQQLAYWGVPPFYSVKLGEAELFAIDATVFLPGYDNCYSDNPTLALQKANIQLQWLEKALSESQAKFKIVYGHYPLYTSGDHAVDVPLAQWRARIEPVLAKHQVDAYLAGHDHHYERTAPIQGIRHFISGAAGKLTKKPAAAIDYPQERRIPKHHFMIFEQTPQGLRYEVISKKGKILDAGLIPPRQTTQLRFA